MLHAYTIVVTIAIALWTGGVVTALTKPHHSFLPGALANAIVLFGAGSLPKLTSRFGTRNLVLRKTGRHLQIAARMSIVCGALSLVALVIDVHPSFFLVSLALVHCVLHLQQIERIYPSLLICCCLEHIDTTRFDTTKRQQSTRRKCWQSRYCHGQKPSNCDSEQSIGSTVR